MSNDMSKRSTIDDPRGGDQFLYRGNLVTVFKHFGVSLSVRVQRHSPDAVPPRSGYAGLYVLDLPLDDEFTPLP